jgi:SAM-dependent methyltransferase
LGLPKNTFSPDRSGCNSSLTDDPLLQANHLGYSLRRYFVDQFHFRHVPALPAGSRVLDLGGNKTRKRGQFDIESYDLRVVYVNLSVAKRPDVQADAVHIPFKDGCFDAVICSELLEHVLKPLAVLREVHCVLKGGGILLICVPFLVRVHGDPYDYGRYTDYYWKENLTKMGFAGVEIEKQGLFWGVLMDMLRELAYQMMRENRPKSAWARCLVVKLIDWGRRAALARDTRSTNCEHPFFSSFTTGFGIVAAKKSPEP